MRWCRCLPGQVNSIRTLWAPSGRTSSRWKSPSPKARASRSTATRWLAELGVRRRLQRPRRAGAAPARLRGRRGGPIDPAPGVAHGDGRPLRRPGPTQTQERLRRGRVRHRDAAPTASSWAATASARSATSTPSSATSRGEPLHDPERHLHARGGLRHALEAHRLAARAQVEVRRSRRLVVSSVSTVENYEYGFFWYLYQDGTIQLEVKLTGILSAGALPPGEPPEYGQARRPAAQRARTTSTSSTSGSTSTSTGRRTRSSRWKPNACPRARTTRSATPS